MSTTTFPVAVGALLQLGAHIRRSGWRNRFHLELEDYNLYKCALIVRVNDDSGERMPWAVVTEDDFQQSDWEIIEGTAQADIPEGFTPAVGTYAHALGALLAGAKAIRMSVGWHPAMQVRLAPGQVKVEDQFVSMGRVLVLRLPNMEWRYWRPDVRDLSGAWTVVEASAD